jgi:UDP-2,3-diacylglucosamine hydrolase
VAHYFASDIHLRDDHPERGARFRAWLGRLTPEDDLTIVGDLCDFWMAARDSERKLAHDASLAALAEFRRQGGSLTILAGNHDAWLCPLYARELGARIVAEPYDVTLYGLRIRLVHGHRLGARKRWKAAMESRAFFRAFGSLPGLIARPLDRFLAWKNVRGVVEDEARHIRVYRSYAATCRNAADLVVVGHVHSPVDEPEKVPRLIVLGGWQRHASYLVVDERGATFVRGPHSAVPCSVHGQTLPEGES